jgi:hypothetical protein
MLILQNWRFLLFRIPNGNAAITPVVLPLKGTQIRLTELP